jgi:hypothetical protein
MKVPVSRRSLPVVIRGTGKHTGEEGKEKEERGGKEKREER